VYVRAIEQNRPRPVCYCTNPTRFPRAVHGLLVPASTIFKKTSIASTVKDNILRLYWAIKWLLSYAADPIT